MAIKFAKKTSLAKLSTRAAAAQLAWQIIDQGHSLDRSRDALFEKYSFEQVDRAFIQELVYGVCRWYGELDHIAHKLMTKPIRKKDRSLHFVLLIGLYQLRHLTTADHAAVSETVKACKDLNKLWGRNLINACLRAYLRKPIIAQESEKLSHPTWIVEQLTKAYPEHASSVLKANNERAPMCLRVNTRHQTRDGYLAKLKKQNIGAVADPYSSSGIVLDSPCSVISLPGFEIGDCSVQDTAAQLGAQFLDTKKGMRVLDACAAPGGKTAHILELTDNQLSLDALDISEARCKELENTLERTTLKANIYLADASDVSTWPTPKEGYDRILIDAPCSGLGVIRRHPDIKHHRRISDIEALNKTQSSLLTSLWPLLKPSGQLLYMTCSILPCENQEQIAQFLTKTNDAILEPLNHPNALSLKMGYQTLPGIHQMDGFYYCLIKKKV